MSEEPRKRRYTKDPTIFLDPGERPMYDAMLEHSAVLKIAAAMSFQELVEMITDIGKRTGEPEENLKPLVHEAAEGVHRILAYAFTLGASFALAQLSKTPRKSHLRDS